LRIGPVGKVVRIVLRILFLVERGDSIGNEVYVDDVDLVVGMKWKHSQAR